MVSHMKKLLSFLFTGVAAIMMSPAFAQGGLGLQAVPAALEGVEYVGKARPKDDAKVYFIYKSRYACSICVAEMPSINKTYRKMKGRGVEIVMINLDKDVATAENWMKKAKIKFPMVAPGQRTDIPFPFDYTQAGLLPHAVAVTADGELLGQASGGEVSEFFDDNWRKFVAKVRKEERKKK